MIVVCAAVGERARILYAGPDLGELDAGEFEQLSQRHHAPGGPEQPIAATLLNTIGTGHPSPPGLLAHRGGQHWAPDPRVTAARRTGDGGLEITTSDPHCAVSIIHSIAIDPASGVASFALELVNDGGGILDLDWCSAVCLPLDERLTRVTSFSGRWAGEFQTEVHDLVRGSFGRENRAGRSSHDSYPGLYFGTPATAEAHGPAAAIHLAWNGNHRIRADQLADGSLSVQAGSLLLPGEIALAPGERFAAPTIHAVWSVAGYGAVTRSLHGFVRAHRAAADLPRPVHYNTWEAVYFDHSPEKLFALAERAAEVGAERFVLDDGWFGARRSDRAGLGDWFVAGEIYPDGLQPLADHVRSLGMEFGLWFEPEMVNPDSEICRSYPDWVLGVDGAEPIASRHQLPLDLTRAEVCNYLFERIDALVRELGIAYIKWDMNRDIQHPGGSGGRAVMHAQALAVRGLIARIKAAHPALVIESCASGGARADYSILEDCDRVWTSDNNDARQRHAIMRGAAHFLPLEVLGNHVGPRRCHITGRRFDMAFRAGTAVFGHMGMELDLGAESEADREILKSAIALHKQHRGLIHAGDYHRLETPAHVAGIGVTARDLGTALFQIAILDQHPVTHPPRIRFTGLDPARLYRAECIWPKAQAREPNRIAGTALMEYGLQLPLTYPDTCLIYHLEAVT